MAMPLLQRGAVGLLWNKLCGCGQHCMQASQFRTVDSSAHLGLGVPFRMDALLKHNRCRGASDNLTRLPSHKWAARPGTCEGVHSPRKSMKQCQSTNSTPFDTYWAPADACMRLKGAGPLAHETRKSAGHDCQMPGAL